MHSSLAGAQATSGDLRLATESDIRSQVWQLLTTLRPRARGLERRRDQRYPYPYLFAITPMLDCDALLVDETVIVAGKNVSERGLSFFHPAPLAYRRVVASLENGGGAWLSFVLDLNWCRFTRHGWYESGGQFLRKIATPQALLD